MGYSKYDYKNKDTDNSRNGYSQKTVQDNLGEIEINVLRDRKGEYASQLVKKHQTDVSGIEDKVIDFTYLNLKNGAKRYNCSIIDLYDRSVVAVLTVSGLAQILLWRRLRLPWKPIL